MTKPNYKFSTKPRKKTKITEDEFGTSIETTKTDNKYSIKSNSPKSSKDSPRPSILKRLRSESEKLRRNQSEQEDYGNIIQNTVRNITNKPNPKLIPNQTEKMRHLTLDEEREYDRKVKARKKQRLDNKIKRAKQTISDTVSTAKEKVDSARSYLKEKDIDKKVREAGEKAKGFFDQAKGFLKSKAKNVIDSINENRRLREY